MSSHAYLAQSGVIPIAHRGGALESFENTMAAFAHAYDLGYRYMETDVQCTKDGFLVAFHDASLERLTGRPGKIQDMALSELADFRVLGAEPIPRFEDLIAAWPDTRWNIEPKDDPSRDALADLIAREGLLDRVCIGSFQERRIGYMRRLLGPGLCTSMGRSAVARLRFASWGLPAGEFEAACVQIPKAQYRIPLADRALVDFAHGLGMKVHIWTVDTEAEMRDLIALGVDGVMTDRPSLLKEVMESLGIWPDPVVPPSANG